LPIEEAENYREYAHKQSIDTIFLATPTTSKNRLENIIDFTSGFLYLVSVFGITGTRERLDQLTTNAIKKFKPFTSESSPLAVGFGISKSEHVRSVINNGADGAIVGSAFVKIIENNLNNSSNLLSDISNFAMSLKSATITKNQ